MEQATFRGTRSLLLQRLRQLPACLSNRTSYGSVLVRQLYLAVGLEALSLIKEAYIVKSRGGTDEAGISWAPLSPRYIAYSRLHPGLNRKRAEAAKRWRSRRPLLTEAQDKLWRLTYSRMLKSLHRKGQTNAESAAAAIAWIVVKRAGGKTILAIYGSRQVEIGRDTGRLLNSLSPTSAAGASNSDQIFRVDQGAVVVGTNVRYAEAFHRKRKLWPDAEAIPESWKRRIAAVLADGVAMLVQTLTGPQA